MRALVTGATGFLGGHVVEACLAAGDTVRALVRADSDVGHLGTLPGVELVVGDLADTDALDAATRDIDVVHHSAALVSESGSRERFVESNVEGTRRLLASARRNGVERFVHVSTPSVVMTGRDQVDIDEREPYPRRHLSHYAATKAAAERLVLAANSARFTTCALRPRAVWGPRDRHGPLPRLLGKMLTGSLPDLSGGKRVVASLCYCENAAWACVRAARSDRVGGKSYFVADPEQVELWPFLWRLAEVFDVVPPRRRVSPLARDAAVAAVELLWRVPLLARLRPPPLSRYSMALLTVSSTYDTGAARRDFGFTPSVDLESGLERTKRWVDSVGGVQGFVRHTS